MMVGFTLLSSYFETSWVPNPYTQIIFLKIYGFYYIDLIISEVFLNPWTFSNEAPVPENYQQYPFSKSGWWRSLNFKSQFNPNPNSLLSNLIHMWRAYEKPSLANSPMFWGLVVWIAPPRHPFFSKKLSTIWKNVDQKFLGSKCE